MHDQQTGSGEFSRVSEPVMIAADSSPVVLHRVRVCQYDVELWDEEDGLVTNTETGERHPCSWSIELNDEHTCVDFHCSALMVYENRRIIHRLIDATIKLSDGSEVRIDTCRAI